MGIGKNIEKYRKRKNLMQKELASLIGVTPQAISNYESGVSSPKEPILFKLLDVLEVTPDELFSGCYAESKKSPAPEGAEDEEKVQAVVKGLTSLLVEVGWVAPGADLTDAQLRTLASYVIAINFYFKGDL